MDVDDKEDDDTDVSDDGGNKPSKSKGKKKAKKADEGEDDDDGSGQDGVLKFGGIAPEHVMKNSESVDVFSYTIKRVDNHYYCTCNGWKFSKNPVDARTCTHLKSYLGDEYEEERIKKNSNRQKLTASGRPKRKTADDDDDDDDEGSAKKKKKVDITIPNVLLAKKWEDDIDPTGWWMSEKLDGVRAYWHPEAEAFVSRNGNKFYAPEWFTKKLPRDMSLDGELFAGRGKFASTVSVVRSMDSPHWKKIEYHIFDAPSISDLTFEKRMDKIKGFLEKAQIPHARLVEHVECKGKKHLYDMLKDVEGRGGEGLMLRKPKSKYEFRRSNTLLKVKSFYDAEAVVLAHEKGSGKNSNVMGALKCRMASGKTFKIGSGFTDKERANPPKIGSIVTYKFQELSPSGVPRFPTFVGVRIDADEPSDAKIRTITRTKSDLKRDAAWNDDGDEDEEE
ncbi:hypothetical protein HDU97_004406 [Phlyctochytrium planicorne]|nr:hypothetical protein HDU97_004406 [Phlyctochytrium planicorne]